ncbi:MAG: hypothetical protein H0V01_09885 [Bacteroidetes bacterium]|nr:hypothetical protein [Bacteroidota bacterium]HET6244541.1 S41 family peptidase [Bacteroidia bacterium]
MKSYLFAFFFLISLHAYSQNKQQIEYLKTFSKAYGYVKYFHPSDEASEIEWGKYAIYGAKEVEKCSTKEELLLCLNKLFLPIAPTIKFYDSSIKTDFDPTSVTPINIAGYKQTYWQHNGVSTDMEYQQGIYKSIRVNKSPKSSGKNLFKSNPLFEQAINKDIGSGISCIVPMTLYFNKKGSYPISDGEKKKELDLALQNVEINPEKLELRHGNTINVWNVFQHFYPYFNVVDVNWEKELHTALEKCYSNKTATDFLHTLQEFTAPLQDGHIRVKGGLPGIFRLPVSWEWIENKLVITKVRNEDLDIKPGDIVSKINDQTPEEFFKPIENRISASTKGRLDFIAKHTSVTGYKDTEMQIEVNGRILILKHEEDLSLIQQPKNPEEYKVIEESIIYLNINYITSGTINKIMPELLKAQAIICDLRGYPNSNHDFISHLLKSDDTTKAWMLVPQIIYPNQEKNIGYSQHGWGLKAKKPYLGGKVIFIIDAQAISYAESYMAYIEGYKLATIVGQPTAGTNGNVNPFKLPGDYKISWTGMKVVKHNGSQLHGIGILPDVYVYKTISGIAQGKDEFLDKAIEIAKEKIITN